MKYSFDPKELTAEKSLWQVYLLCRRIKLNRISRVALITSALLLSAYVFGLQDSIDVLLSDTRALAGHVLNFSLSVLGFLIAGFTIFATLSKPQMLLKMMDVVHSKTNLPYLKYNFMAFMRVFIYYLAMAAFSLGILLFAGKNGPVAKAVSQLADPVYIKVYMVRIVYVALGTGTVFLLLLLKTFIFNIYAMIMTQLRWEVNGIKDFSERDGISRRARGRIGHYPGHASGFRTFKRKTQS
jgi:hypothetical protein